MKCPPIPPDEEERLLALASYGLSGERPLPTLDPVVKLATYMFDIPTAAVNMIGSDHVFLAAKTGMGTVDLRRDVSFCAHAITQRGVMVVRDSLLDERFSDNRWSLATLTCASTPACRWSRPVAMPWVRCASSTPSRATSPKKMANA